jgi:aryl-alcohol dehydrogenase-like predicted oxidoreductase
MKTRTLGYTGINLSAVGLGTFAMGGGRWKFAWGPQDDKESIDTILHALESGINWIDTAAVYGFGHSEEIVGKALQGLKERPFIATKCGRRWDINGNIYAKLKRDSIRKEVDDSLKRLKVDVIDLYQIHWPEPDEDIEEAWETITDFIEDGQIRYGGVSNFSLEQIKRVMNIHPIASLQPPYSILKRNIENKILPFCKKHNIGVIVYSPMHKGLLTGKFTKERVLNLPKDDHRRMDSEFLETKISSNLKLIKKLEPIAVRKNITLAQLAIAWTLRREEVTAAIVGARHPSQIEETVISSDLELKCEDIKEIEKILKEREER